jgi:hypothetical protein
MNPETLKAMKEAAEKVQATDLKPSDWPSVRTLGRVFIPAEAEMVALCTPVNVSALIADYERVVEQLKAYQNQGNNDPYYRL